MRLDLPDEGAGGGGYAITQQEPRSVTGHAIESIVNGGGAGRHRIEEETIAGFVMYRLENGVVEYLLLKKFNQNDWSPPKDVQLSSSFGLGHVESGEDCFEGAEREVLEETHLSMGDYETLEQYPIYFEYKARQQVLKRVHLWAARYLNYEKPIILSPEHDEFQWLDYEAAGAVVKSQYKEALMAADLVIRTFESL